MRQHSTTSGGRAFDPCKLQPKFYTTEGCHMTSHVWAMWHHTIGPQTCHVSTPDMSTSYVKPPCHVNTSTESAIHVTLPCQLYGHTNCTVSFHVACTDCTINKIFVRLRKWTKHDISRIRHPFEPVQVALGL
jgi:hypothetical protein